MTYALSQTSWSSKKCEMNLFILREKDGQVKKSYSPQQVSRTNL
jgi:hypothetical protein